MKKKTVALIIERKFKHWLKSIKDEEVKKLVEENTIITGGCIASLLLNEEPNDFDIYFTNKETALAVARYYVDKFKDTAPQKNGIPIPVDVIELEDRIKIVVKSAGVISNEDDAKEDISYQYFEGDPDPNALNSEEYVDAAFTVAKNAKNPDKYLPVFMSSNAITLGGDVQIITRFFGDADEIHKNFDFVHCTSYWTSSNDKDGFSQLVLRPEALECLLGRELRYSGSRYPIASILRIRKFIERGYTINAGQVLKMVLQIKDLNLDDVNVLEEQLIGVDVAYFQQLISMLKQGQEEGVTIDSTYIMKLVDRIF